MLKEVLASDIEWYIDQGDNGKYYIKYANGGVVHSSGGIGDGIWSVFTICSAFFDIQENETAVINEPELLVHPALQKRLMKLLLRYSEKNQIIICTHSPYFINWNAICNGAQFIWVVKEGKIPIVILCLKLVAICFVESFEIIIPMFLGWKQMKYPFWKVKSF